jgi:hypothetical protein
MVLVFCVHLLDIEGLTWGEWAAGPFSALSDIEDFDLGPVSEIQF